MQPGLPGNAGVGAAPGREKWITTGRILPHPDARLSGCPAVRTPLEHTRLQLELYLNMHTKTAWPQLAGLRIRHRASSPTWRANWPTAGASS